MPEPTIQRQQLGGEMSTTSSGGRSPLRLLFLVPFTPRHDARHGGRVVAQLLARLAKRNTVGVVYLREHGVPPMEAELTATCDFVEAVEPTRRSKRADRLSRLLSSITGVPAAAAIVRQREFLRACTAAARSWNPDVIQVEQDLIADLGPVLRQDGYQGKLVLVCHEPGVLAAADQAEAATGLHEIVHRLDGIAWRRFWHRTLPSFDVVVALTRADERLIAKEIPSLATACIGLGVEIPAKPLGPVDRSDPKVLFVGGYRHPPNLDAAMRLLRSIMPAVRERRPGTQLTLVGADPAQEMLDSAGPHDTITGTVAEVDPYVADAALLAIPIRLGGGMRVKLLEALAAGKAIATSKLAAAGLDLVDGVQVAFAETDEEFADAIVRLIDDEAALRGLGEQARKWARANLGWRVRTAAYERLYEDLLAGRV